MAVVFSTDTDDSGLGLDGTVRNNAWKQAMATAINTAIVAGGTAYTPSWTATGTAPALGNGTSVGRYWQTDKLVTCSIVLTMGSTTTFGTGNYRLSLPFTASSTNMTASVIAVDNSSTFIYAGYVGFVTTSTIQILAAGGTASVWGQTFPFTWAVSDSIILTFTYERT